MYKRILVPTDGSKLSDKAVAAAVRLAALCGAEIVGLSVVAKYPTSFFEGAAALTAEDIRRIEKQWSDEGQATADKVTAAAESAGVKAKAVTVKSDVVSDAILKTAAKHKCDLIVMASHGRKGLRRILLGSETQQVLTHGTLPVLVLR